MRYECLVISHKKAGKSSTMKKCLTYGIRPRVFVQEEQYDDYAAAYPTCFVEAYPGDIDDATPIGAKRKYVLKKARELGLRKFWFFDDDITKVCDFRTYGTKRYANDWERDLSTCEDETEVLLEDPYDGAYVRLTYAAQGSKRLCDEVATGKKKPFGVEERGLGPANAWLLNLEFFDKHDIDYDPAFGWGVEDADVTCQLRAKGLTGVKANVTGFLDAPKGTSSMYASRLETEALEGESPAETISRLCYMELVKKHGTDVIVWNEDSRFHNKWSIERNNKPMTAGWRKR